MNVIVFPRGQLSPKDKERLTKSGIVAVEADDPSKVVVCVPSSPMITNDDLLLSAMFGMSSDGSQTERSLMVKELYRRMKAKESS